MDQGLEDFHTESTPTSPDTGDTEPKGGSNFWRFFKDV